MKILDVTAAQAGGLKQNADHKLYKKKSKAWVHSVFLHAAFKLVHLSSAFLIPSVLVFLYVKVH